MSHLEERLEHDLNEIRDHIANMGSSVEQALDGAFRAATQRGRQTGLHHDPVGSADQPADAQDRSPVPCFYRGPPAERRTLTTDISSVIRANIILERIGDYAVTIAREAVQLGETPQGGMSTRIDKISDEAISILSESISAFNSSNAERARASIAMAAKLEREMDGVYAELLDGAENGGDEARDIMIYLIIFSQLKRVADQAKNLAEQTVFVETGEDPRQPKIYRILFLDEDNSCLGPMAELIAGKVFPGIGQYTSAGHHPADSLNPDMVTFMQERGFNLSAMRPQQLDTSRESLAHYHVIVGLHKKVLKTVVKLPFRTSALNWKDVDVPPGADPGEWEEPAQNSRAAHPRVVDPVTRRRGLVR